MKNKHAKGPDGQPLIAFNSGRGRGRPKKNSLTSRNHVEPTNSNFFRTLDKIGGPIEPTVGFNDAYTEIFIKKKTKIIHEIKDEPDGSEDEDDKDGENDDQTDRQKGQFQDAAEDGEDGEDKDMVEEDGEEK